MYGVGILTFLCLLPAFSVLAEEPAVNSVAKTNSVAADSAAPADPAVAGALFEAGDWAAASNAFHKVLLTETNAAVRRPVRALLTETQLRLYRQNGDTNLLQSALSESESLQLGGLDIAFGRAVACWAFIRLEQGFPADASAAVQEQASFFEQLDRSLAEQKLMPARCSPSAFARYVLGCALERQADAAEPSARRELLAGALKEYLHVFALYCDSVWAADAGAAAERLTEKLVSEGARIEVDFGKYLPQVVRARFRAAEMKARDMSSVESEKLYLDLLALYPDCPAAVEGWTELGLLYLQRPAVGETVSVATNVAACFPQTREGADALLRLAKASMDAGFAEESFGIYETYLESFSQDPRAPEVLLSMASLKLRASETPAGEHYLERLLVDYPDAAECRAALRLLAWNGFKRKEYAKVLPYFTQLCPLENEPQRRIRAEFARAACLYVTGQWTEASEIFAAIGVKSSQVRLKESGVPARALYLEARCLEKSGETESAFMKFGAVAEKFSTDTVAPKALRRMVLLKLDAGVSDEVLELADRLCRAYPDSDECRTVWVEVLRRASESDHTELLAAATEYLLADPVRYGAEMPVRAAMLLEETGRLEAAAELYESAVVAEDAGLRQRALWGAARMRFRLEQFGRTRPLLETLLTDFPRFSEWFEAQFMLAECAAESGDLDAALSALGEVLANAEAPEAVQRANLEIGRVHPEPAERLAALQRVALLSDPADEVLKPLVEAALTESMDLCAELERPELALVTAKQYLEQFPDGPANARMRGVLEEKGVMQ